MTSDSRWEEHQIPFARPWRIYYGLEALKKVRANLSLFSRRSAENSRHSLVLLQLSFGYPDASPTRSLVIVQDV